LQKVRPFLWFDDNAEDAANFYVSVFKDAKITDVRRYGEAGPGEDGSVMTVTFELYGQEFIALNGGPEYRFTPAISFFVDCATQQEVDDIWDELALEGTPQQCGWITDKFGVTWQIIPSVLGELLGDDDDEKSARAMQAMLKMVKIDSAELQRAFDGVDG
jgi:predicted 3-demethylubiquinone-9 3-methyltransferase (glyoxalase superfamily)